MPKRMLVHDHRLGGNPPHIAQNTYEVNRHTPVAHIVAWIGEYAHRQNGLDELIVMCHGYAELEDEPALMTRTEPIGAAGLALGKEGLTPWNVDLTAAWKPHGRPRIARIYLYACGVSAASRYNDPYFDGRRFCGEMALYSGAEVYAADRLQYYQRLRTLWQVLWGSNEAGTIDFGKWEGQVFRYSPETGQPSRIKVGAQPT